LGSDRQDPLIGHYLASLRRALLLRGVWDAEIVAEIRGHLTEAVERGLAGGLDREAAQRLAILRFGAADALAAQFFWERITRMQTILLLIGALLGGTIAFVDSRPTWDDTGITVLALLLVSGLLASVSPRRPWKWALAVGIWLPFYEIYLTHHFGLLFVLIIPFIGAYAGAAFNWMIRHAFHPA
jgi:hypothetical protein